MKNNQFQSKSPRINKLFDSKQTPVLSPYLTAGFPNKAVTVDLMHTMVEAGSDIIELGIPFSEPMAEGETIQRAMEIALNQHVSTDDVFEMVRSFRKSNNHTPIILMGYTNPIEIIGYQVFASKANAAGVDGTIIVDSPPEEIEQVIPDWQQNELDMIFLCSPTTSADRMHRIKQNASGYVYYVSLKGVTGSQALNIEDVKALYQQRKQILTSTPLFVGFGIKTVDDVKQLSQFVDGVVIGAAFLEAIENASDPLQACRDFISPIASALEQV